MTPYGDRDLGQHWLRQWLVAWWHQAITWTNVDWSSAKSSDIHIRAISLEMPQPSITKICLKITCLRFHSNFPGAYKLSSYCWICSWDIQSYTDWAFFSCNLVCILNTRNLYTSWLWLNNIFINMKSLIIWILPIDSGLYLGHSSPVMNWTLLNANKWPLSGHEDLWPTTMSKI